MSGLRDRILSQKASDIGIGPSSEMPAVWGVLMETGFPQAVVTLVSLADRTTSLYVSTGGGVIGTGSHHPVAEATIGLLLLAQEYRTLLKATTMFPEPGVGRVRFYVLTFSGVLTAEADEQELGHGRHELSALFHKSHEVMAMIRICTESRA